MSTPPPLRWGIASTGRISAEMTRALAEVEGAEVVAVGSRDATRAAAFAAEHGIERAHGEMAALWDDPDVDVVYVGSPHSEHHAMAIEALRAGKHVLCEKAFTVNARQASDVIATAEAEGRFVMEAMWSWFMPVWHEVRDRIAAGDLGELRLVDADFGIAAPDPDGRHRRRDLAGGALLDLGIYPLALGRFLLGEPSSVRAVGTLTDEGVDAVVGGALRHDGGAVTTFSSTIDAWTDRSARIVGTEGVITIPAPFWHPDRYVLARRGGEPEVIELANRGLAHEAAHVVERVRAGELQSDVVGWDATMSGMELMDEVRRQLGVTYPADDARDVSGDRR